MPEIGRLVAIIDGDLTGLERALGNAQKVLNRAGNQMKAAGGALSLGVTAPIVAIGGLAIKASMDFETAFAGVNKTVDATAQELDVLRKGIIDMSKEMPATAVEIAGVAEAAGQLGVKKEDILSFTKTMVMLGETTNLTATEAATSMAKFANVMQVPAKDIERLSSVLVDLGNNGASTERDILELAQRIASAGKTVGMSAQDVLGLANALSSVGITAEAGGTAVSRVLIDMAQAAANLKPSEEQLKAIGDAQRDVRDSSLALESANRGVRDAFEGVTDAQRGVRDATEGIASAQRNTRNATESLRDAQTALTRAYRDQRQASLDARRETLSVAEAQQGLREVQAQSGSQALEVRSAQLALADAQRRLGEASKKGGLEQAQAALGVQQAQARLNQVMVQGPRYALDLRNAQLRLEEAQSRVGRSAEQSRDQIVQAQRGIRNASEGLAEAQRGERNAAEGVASAQRNLRNSYENVGEAQHAALVAQEKYAESQAKLNTLMEQVFGKLGNYAKLAGMLPEQFAALVKSNPSEAFTLVVEGMQRTIKEGGNLFKVLEELGLEDVRVRDTMLSLANGGDILRNSLNLGRKAFTDNTALTVEYGKKSATTAAQLEIMRNRVNANAIMLGDELTPTLLQVTQNMAPLIDAFAKLTAVFAGLPGPVQTTVIAVFGLSAALGPALFGLGQMMKIGKEVIGMAPLMRSAFLLMRAGAMAFGTALLTPPLGIIIALAALAIAIYIFRDDIMKVLGPALEWAGNAATKAGKAISDALGKALNFVRNNWKEIATLIAGPFAPLVILATDAFGIRSAILKALDAVVGFFRSLPGWILSALGNVGNILYNVGRDIVAGMLKGISDKWKDLTNWLGKAIGKLPKPVQKLLEIGSPSKVFQEIGENIVQGLALGLKTGEGLSVPAPQMPMVQMPTYNHASSYAMPRSGLMATEGAGTTGGDFARAPGGLKIDINGPVRVVNTGKRQDATGALGDLAFGVKGQLNRRGIYA